MPQPWTGSSPQPVAARQYDVEDSSRRSTGPLQPLAFCAAASLRLPKTQGSGCTYGEGVELIAHAHPLRAVTPIGTATDVDRRQLLLRLAVGDAGRRRGARRRADGHHTREPVRQLAVELV